MGNKKVRLLTKILEESGNTLELQVRLTIRKKLHMDYP